MRYITHLIPIGLPDKGLRKVSFYTIDSADETEEYFLGVDNNPFSFEDLQRLVRLNKAYKISTFIGLDRVDQTLYVDSDNYFYLANYIDSEKDRRKLDIVVPKSVMRNTELNNHDTQPESVTDVIDFKSISEMSKSSHPMYLTMRNNKRTSRKRTTH